MRDNICLKGREEGKDQELIHSGTAPDPGRHMEKRQKIHENITHKRAKRESLLSW